MKARVLVTLKREVLDPQGEAVRRSLGDLGFQNVHSARIGKLIELDVDDGTTNEQVERMCQRLLANPVIEDYQIELEG